MKNKNLLSILKIKNQRKTLLKKRKAVEHQKEELLALEKQALDFSSSLNDALGFSSRKDKNGQENINNVNKLIEDFSKLTKRVNIVMPPSPCKKDIDKIEKVLSECQANFKLDNNYQLLMQSAISCIHQLNTLENKYKEDESDLKQINEHKKQCYMILVGESYSADNFVYGAKRLNELMSWTMGNIENDKKYMQDLFVNKKLEELMIFIPGKQAKCAALITWIATLNNEYPFSSEYNQIIVKQCIGKCEEFIDQIKSLFLQVTSAKNELEYCITSIRKYDFLYYNRLKDSLASMKTDYQMIVTKSESVDLIYLENTFLPRYEEIITKLKDKSHLYTESAPYSLEFSSIAIDACKKIVDHIHSIKQINDPKQKLKSIKDKIINFYEETNLLFKKAHHDPHAWLNDLYVLLDKIRYDLHEFDRDAKKQIMKFVLDLNDFLKGYKDFYHMNSPDHQNTKLIACVNLIDHINKL